jgi:uncharacterized OB-fold protein
MEQMMTEAAGAGRDRVPIREGLLTGDLSRLGQVRLAGCRCESCGETSFGHRSLCPNCGRDTVEDLSLSDRGTVWTYTVVRHRPPGAYKGPEPFEPFGLGLVELPDGLRVMSPIECDIDKLRIGMPVRFKPYVRHDPDRDVVAFAFEAIAEENANV